MDSPIAWVGGKSRLVDRLIPLIPAHKYYVEVFGGAGWLLFTKPPEPVEVLNDFDSNLMNFWNVVKHQHSEFIHSFEYTLVSRETFDQYKQIYKSGKYDSNLHRAHIFYYLVRSSFASDMRNPVFGTGKERKNGLNLIIMPQEIQEAYKRLQNVVIENKSFEQMFEIYDSPDAFFFLDSPYRNTKQYAVGDFTDDHYRLLHECCQNAQCKWMYTINDDPFIRELFSDFNIISHEVGYSVCATDNGRREFSELIITNYDTKTCQKAYTNDGLKQNMNVMDIF